ncbi:MAG TPA: GDSL-type esterase/lipase family protein, partial [Acidimicrobiales bacterium]|nr:GDSL-type esterase/lipase family protein [Acidimicrobiales bacterium]
MVVLALATSLLAVVGPAPAPAAAADNDDYVALGDSYTSGPLIPDQTGQPLGCLRSSRDYPRLVAQALGLSLTDVSCSGAETPDMANAQGVTPGPNPPQFDALSADTDIVTVQIGGNDIGFSEIIQNCIAIIPLTAVCQPDYVRNGTDQISQRIAATAPKVAAVLQGIRQRSPNARVYVVGYPAILPESGGGCWPSVPLSNADLPWLREKNKELNAMLAAQAVANGARYVDVYTPGIGHDACQSNGVRWVEGIIPAALQAAPIHPNATGMAGMAQVVAARILATPNLATAPRSVVATPGNAQVALTWAAPDDDGGGAITAYRVYRDGVALPTAFSAAQRSYLDEDVVNGTTYRYAVAAVNGVGEGARSTEAEATPVAGFVCCPPNGYADVPGALDAAVDWATYFEVAGGFSDATFRPGKPLKR